MHEPKFAISPAISVVFYVIKLQEHRSHTQHSSLSLGSTRDELDTLTLGTNVLKEYFRVDCPIFHLHKILAMHVPM